MPVQTETKRRVKEACSPNHFETARFVSGSRKPRPPGMMMVSKGGSRKNLMGFKDDSSFRNNGLTLYSYDQRLVTLLLVSGRILCRSSCQDLASSRNIQRSHAIEREYAY